MFSPVHTTLHSYLRIPLILAVAAITLGAGASLVRADDGAGGDPDEATNKPGSYWSVLLQGGMLTPLGDMQDEHQSSLAAGMRIGWISRLGLGVDIVGEYSPLSRKPSPAEDVYETHFVTAGVQPRFTLGKRAVRLWVAAGGGVSYERTKHVATLGVELGPTTNHYALTAGGAVGLELHLASGLGLAVIGSYGRSVGQIEHELVNVTGGLAFTF